MRVVAVSFYSVEQEKLASYGLSSRYVFLEVMQFEIRDHEDAAEYVPDLAEMLS